LARLKTGKKKTDTQRERERHRERETERERERERERAYCINQGTPARLDSRTINYDGLIIQEGDQPPNPFSYLNTTVPHAVSE
jgi:tRNA U34 5-carboxymethylaminomethyl modifying enzyme MnmG/GidA